MPTADPAASSENWFSGCGALAWRRRSPGNVLLGEEAGSAEEVQLGVAAVGWREAGR